MHNTIDHGVQLKADTVRQLIRAKGYRTYAEFSRALDRNAGYITDELRQYGGAVRIDTARKIADRLEVRLPDIIDTTYLTYLKRRGLLK